MKVALVHPPITLTNPKRLPQVQPPLGIAYLAACLRAHAHDVQVVDGLGEGIGRYSRFREDYYIHGLPIKEIVDRYDTQSADIVGRLKALPAARWDGTLEFFGSQRPASPMAWGFLFDIVHHRGQITTYLRPMGSTVPQIYGPSADEP